MVGTVLTLRFLRSTSVPASAKSALPDVQNPYPEIIRGCLLYNTTRTVYVGWVIITIEEGGMLKILSRGLYLIGTGITVDLALMIISALKTCQSPLVNLSSLWMIVHLAEQTVNADRI